MPAKIVCNLDEAIDLFRYSYGVELEKVIRYTQTALIKTFFSIAPPRTRKQGRRAVDISVHQMFLDNKYFAKNYSNNNTAVQETVKNYFKTGRYDALQDMQQKGVIFRNIRIKPFDKSDIRKNNRGKIIKTGTKILVTDPKRLTEFIKHEKEKVGQLKGSFIVGLQHFGGTNWPGWIKRNKYGTYIDNTKPTTALGKQSASSISNVWYGYLVDQRMQLIQRTYEIQSAKLVGMVKAGVLNQALTRFYSS